MDTGISGRPKTDVVTARRLVAREISLETAGDVLGIILMRSRDGYFGRS